MKNRPLHRNLNNALIAAAIIAALALPLNASAEAPLGQSYEIARSDGSQGGMGGMSNNSGYGGDRDRSQDRDHMSDQDRMRDRDRMHNQLQTHLQTMDQLRDRIRQSGNTGNRQELMNQYREQIRQSMQLMNQSRGQPMMGDTMQQRHVQQMDQMMRHMWQYQELQEQ